MIYRSATMDDADMLMRWRNDKLTVAQFRSNRAVSLIEHEKWLRDRLGRGDPTFIALEDNLSGRVAAEDEVGTVHMDPMEHKENGFEVSVTVAPEARGRGLGGKILKMVCDDFPEATLYTEIKFDNKASEKSFGAAGFVQIGSYGLWTQWRRMPLR